MLFSTSWLLSMDRAHSLPYSTHQLTCTYECCSPPAGCCPWTGHIVSPTVHTNSPVHMNVVLHQLAAVHGLDTSSPLQYTPTHLYTWRLFSTSWLLSMDRAHSLPYSTHQLTCTYECCSPPAGCCPWTGHIVSPTVHTNSPVHMNVVLHQLAVVHGQGT